MRFRRETVGNAQSLMAGVGALLTPAAVMAGVLGVWRIGNDLDWTSGFFIPAGLFSHWQVWIAIAVALQMAAAHLKRAASFRATERKSESPVRAPVTTQRKADLEIRRGPVGRPRLPEPLHTKAARERLALLATRSPLKAAAGARHSLRSASFGDSDMPRRAGP